MKQIEKKKEIVDKILEIPLEKWKGYVTELNGLTIIFDPTHSNYAKFFEINGIKFNDDRCNAFRYKLHDFQIKKEEEKELSDIDKIHEIIFTHETNRI